jgi:hypothetical protein
MQESGSSSQPASITTPAQAARMPPPDFQALAFAVLHTQLHTLPQRLRRPACSSPRRHQLHLHPWPRPTTWTLR